LKTYYKEIRSKADWIGHILRRNCFLKNSIEGKIEGRIAVKGRRRRRRKQLLVDVQTYYTELKSKANWIGHILRRNCLIKRVIEGKIEGRMAVKGRRRRRRKQLLDDVQEKSWYWKLKEETLASTL
jgi:hypothetical protein